MKKMYSFVLCAMLIGQITLAQQQTMDVLVQNYFNAFEKSSDASGDVFEWKITDVVPSLNKRVQHVYIQQFFQGIPIQYATYKLNVRDGKDVIWKIDQFVKDPKTKITSKSTGLTPESAIMKVVNQHGLAAPQLSKTTKASDKGEILEFKNSGITIDNEPITAQKVYYKDQGDLRLAWRVSIYEKDGQNWWNTFIDMDNGKVLAEENWVIHCDFGTPDHSDHSHGPSILTKEEPAIDMAAALAPDSYNVYPVPVESPIHGSRSIVTDPADPTASPFGWHDTNGSAGAEYTITRGNNVWAQEDRNGNNGTGRAPDGGSSLDFNFPVDLSQSPTAYEAASVTNLFYWNNVVHDIFYQYGFDEASGNFQENNYGKGGRGSDSVNADAQDGSGTNNANFATPGDGSNPRMQMFLWNRTNPGRDGDFDNVIIVHEYGHGISIRLVGGPSSNTLGGSEQMGEGWSDWFGLMLTMKAGDVGTDGRGVGAYVLGQGTDGAGIRPTRYSIDRSINNTDYADIGGLARPHGVGYAFATILWDMTWALIDAEGFDPDLYNGTGGNNIALALVTEGLKNTANNPGFVSGRDGILQADRDLYGGQYECIIWKAFAERGVGEGANENTNGGTNGQTDQTVSFVNPCDNTPPPPVQCTGDVASFPYSEGFEGSIGDWTQDAGDDLNWTVNSGGTPSNSTGPSSAAEGNSYIYVEASGDGTGFPNKTAILNSPCLDFSGLSEAALGFQYHMLGSSVNSLTVEARTNNDGDWVSVFAETGSQGDNWLTAAVNLNAYAGESSVQLRIVVVTGSGSEGWQSDIAIDALTITEGDVTPPPPPTDDCNTTIAAFPYGESFEGSIGAWEQASNDDLDWTVDANGTPSNSTGPSSASDGNSYLYVEASGDGTGFPNKTAVLNSPCFDLSNLPSPVFTFDYHMYGSAINSLTAEARAGTGNWSTVFNESGNQGNTWNSASIDLAAYEGEASVQFRFTVVTGSGSSGWQSDIAIDNVKVIDGSDVPPPPACDSLDFNSFQITGFSNQDVAGDFAIQNGGAALALTNNTWKYIPLNYTVTSNTVIEFDFSSTNQGEIHGVGFENDNTLTQTRYFKVHGTQSYGVTNYDNYSGGTTTYTIPVGNFYTGSMDRLVFINDDDSGSGNTSVFSNVKIYEGSCGSSLAFETLASEKPIIGTEDELDASFQIRIAPNPTSGNFKILVQSNTSRTIETTIYNIIGSKIATISLQKGVNEVSVSELALTSGVYLLRTSIGEEVVTQKLIVD